MSYEFKGTPGEWRIFDHHIGCGVSDGFSDIAHCHGFNAKRFREEERANAQLIAAAPDLFSVLATIVERWDSLVPEEEISEEHKQARAALAKATGEQ